MLPVVIGVATGLITSLGYLLIRKRRRGIKPNTVKLSEIPTWNDYFKKKIEELIKLQPKEITECDEHFSVDADINNRVSIFESDITCLEIDGIVNASNTALVLTAGVSAMIATAGGPDLISDVKAMNGCKCGEAKTTSGHNLPAKYVIHTVGPQNADAQLLESCYKSCLQQMELIQMKSLAFCCISTGSCGYPNDQAVHVALKTVRKWLEDQQTRGKLQEIDRIVFCLFSDFDKCLYESWMTIYFPCENPKELRPLPGFISITTTEPDMITYDDNPHDKRAVMPCGHVIGRDSMTDYVKDLVSKGKYVFPCPDPGCDAAWQYFLVRHVAYLTADETQEIEKTIASNYLNKSKGIQNCPKCRVYCFRKDIDKNCVECSLCTKTDGRRFYFCWICLNDWKGGTGKECGNSRCVAIGDERIRILADCPEKNILNRFMAPSVRGCPKCGLLIEYLNLCTQMNCRGCGHFFCFLCLEGAVTKRELKCDPWNATCNIAPRQTTLQGM